MQISNPVLLIVRGLPGSGKSLLSQSLAKRIGEINSVLLDPDATDYDSQTYKDFSAELERQGVDLKLHPYRFLRGQAYQAIEENKYIIWNQAFTNLEIFRKMIKRLQNHADTHMKKLSILVVEVSAPVEVARERVAARHAEGGHNVDEEAFERFVTNYRSFQGEGFNLVSIDGQLDVSENTEKVIRAFSDL